jgi:hypothetical protein
MKKSFKDKERDEAPETAIDTEALAEVEGGPASMATTDANLSLSLGQVTGSIEQRDLIIPRLAIVQGVGELSEVFTPGDLVLNRDTLLVPKEEPLELTVLSIRKTYEERLPYDPNGPRPKTWATREEVVADGLHTEWVNNEPPPVREVGTILTLIKQPKDIESLSFNQEYDGERFGIAVWTVRNTAYSRAAKKVFSAAAIELAQSGLLAGKWELFTKREQINSNYVFVPHLTLVGKHPAEFVEFIKTQLGS